MPSLKMTSIKLKNFIGIKTGLGKTTLELDFTPLLDKNIILILGDNGYGKSTLSSVLHPLKGTTDKRNKFIIDGKEGLKVVKYIRQDGVKYECKIVYTPTKSGHSCKGYIKKIINGEEVELNPNGNMTSYEEIVFDELGASNAILKLANQNDTSKGLVDDTSSERKGDINKFLPEDIYTSYYLIADKHYRLMKSRMASLVEAIGKLNDKDTIEAELSKVTSEINEIVAKRDKTVGKIKELETRIDIIDKDGNVEKRKDKILSDIKSFDKEIDKLKSKMSKIYNENLSDIMDGSEGGKKITKLITAITKTLNEHKMNLQIITNTLSSLRSRRDSVIEDIENKEHMISDISSDLSLNELKNILEDYESRYSEIDKVISKLNTDLSVNDLVVGYKLIKTMMEMLSVIYSHDPDIVSKVSLNYNPDKMGMELATLYEKRDKLNEIKNSLYNKITSINENANLKDILNKRPKDCTIDDCPFIENAKKWEMFEEELIKCTNGMDDVDKKLGTLAKEISEYEEMSEVYKLMSQLFLFMEQNSTILDKLPENENYNSRDNMLKIMSKRKYLDKYCNFDPYFDILEAKDEYYELQYKKIPSIKNEIKLIESQGKLYGSTKDDIKRLKKEQDKIVQEISEYKKSMSTIEDQISFNENLIDSLGKFYEKRISYDEINEELESSYDELKEVNKLMEESDKYKNKLKEKKAKLKEIDEELNPLTRKRELYKMEQLKLIDFTQEYESLKQDMYICEIVCDSLSPKKDGMPVEAMAMFMDVVRQNANVLLSETFNGSLYLEEFQVEPNAFNMPYRKNGDYGMDVSYASSSERSFIAICLTLAIIGEIVSEYGIVILDEVDRGFSDINKYKFIKILGTQLNMVGLSQVFMTTHNREYYDGYDLGYILFPGHSLESYDDSNAIKVYD